MNCNVLHRQVVKIQLENHDFIKDVQCHTPLFTRKNSSNKTFNGF